MKNTIIFVTTLLVLWIAGCTCFYVCKIRKDCNCRVTKPGIIQEKMEATVAPDSLISAKEEVTLTPPPAYSFQFGLGASTCDLTGEDRNYLALVKQYIDSNPQGKVLITGHADNSGSELINLQISTLRAEFIKQQLLEAGIADMNIKAIGKGELEPVSDNHSIDSRAKNRRVELQTNKN